MRRPHLGGIFQKGPDIGCESLNQDRDVTWYETTMNESSTLHGTGDNVEDMIPEVQARIESYSKVSNTTWTWNGDTR